MIRTCIKKTRTDANISQKVSNAAKLAKDVVQYPPSQSYRERASANSGHVVVYCSPSKVRETWVVSMIFGNWSAIVIPGKLENDHRNAITERRSVESEGKIHLSRPSLVKRTKLLRVHILTLLG